MDKRVKILLILLAIIVIAVVLVKLFVFGFASFVAVQDILEDLRDTV